MKRTLSEITNFKCDLSPIMQNNGQGQDNGRNSVSDSDSMLLREMRSKIEPRSTGKKIPISFEKNFKLDSSAKRPNFSARRQTQVFNNSAVFGKKLEEVNPVPGQHDVR